MMRFFPEKVIIFRFSFESDSTTTAKLCLKMASGSSFIESSQNTLSLRGQVLDQLSAVTNLEMAAEACPHANDWTLHCCCNSVQIQVIVATCVYSILIFIFWNWKFILPLKLVVVALHEWGHATAAWLTCGSVESIEVHQNEGGVTKTRGGNRFIILSAGYLGSAVWGMILVIASADFIGVQVMSGILAISLLVMLFFARSTTLGLLTVFFLLLIAGFWACTVLTDFNGLRFLVLLIGVMSGFFSIYDCYDDLLARRVNESDATMLANHTHTSSRCWGLIWALLSIGFMSVGLYLSLIVGGDPRQT